MTKKQDIIRDRREKGWFYLDNEYLNGYARIFGPVGTAIYVDLCRHADNKTQQCFPSYKIIAEELKISEKTVKRYIGWFKEYRLISVQQRKNNDGTFQSNIYTLLDKSVWKKKPKGTKVPTAPWGTCVHHRGEPVSSGQAQTVGTQSPNKDTHINKTHIKETKRKITPAQEMNFFLTDEEYPKRIAKIISEKKGIPYKQVLSELKNFAGYWTESNKLGTKQRWQLQKTFELRRRLAVWFRNAEKFAEKNRPIII